MNKKLPLVIIAILAVILIFASQQEEFGGAGEEALEMVAPCNILVCADGWSSKSIPIPGSPINLCDCFKDTPDADNCIIGSLEGLPVCSTSSGKNVVVALTCIDGRSYTPKIIETCDSNCLSGSCIGTSTYCGDGTCNGAETTSNCALDCGINDPCANIECPIFYTPTQSGNTCTCIQDTYCGDGICNGAETEISCSIDCKEPTTSCDDVGGTLYQLYFPGGHYECQSIITGVDSPSGMNCCATEPLYIPDGGSPWYEDNLFYVIIVIAGLLILFGFLYKIKR